MKDNCIDCGSVDFEGMNRCEKHDASFCRSCTCPLCEDEDINWNEQAAKIEALEGELKNTQDAMDAYARAFFRLSDAAEKCKETANEAQFRSLKEYYFAALQEIESVLDAALDISQGEDGAIY